jgi:hypothetical protein
MNQPNKDVSGEGRVRTKKKIDQSNTQPTPGRRTLRILAIDGWHEPVVYQEQIQFVQELDNYWKPALDMHG